MRTAREPRFLVIRRDNIGDLVCTTPLITGIRQRYPQAHIAALVNSYNRHVLAGNPDLDAVYSYTKGKHRETGEHVLGVYARRLSLFAQMRKAAYDYAVLATPCFQRHSLLFARLAGAKRVVGFVERAGQGGIEIPVSYGSGDGLHEVEDVWRLAACLDIDGAPPRPRVHPDQTRIAAARAALAHPKTAPLVAIHISARKPSQRWPIECFAALMRAVQEMHGGASFLLLWAPGSESNPTHPGDDAKAHALVSQANDVRLSARPTSDLRDLVAALALSDLVVCSDGGAMHIAAGLGKKIVCLFGDSEPARWHPWGVPHIVLQAATREARDIGVNEVTAAVGRLLSQRTVLE